MHAQSLSPACMAARGGAQDRAICPLKRERGIEEGTCKQNVFAHVCGCARACRRILVNTSIRAPASAHEACGWT
eukprot:4110882-Alexandrium_andersonii.AAC.1